MGLGYLLRGSCVEVGFYGVLEDAGNERTALVCFSAEPLVQRHGELNALGFPFHARNYRLKWQKVSTGILKVVR